MDGETKSGGDTPDDLAARLAGLSGAAGLPMADSAGAPLVNVKAPVHQVVARVADLLRSERYGLYRRGADYGTIDAATGKWQSMDARGMVSWLPNSCGILPIGGFDKESGKAIVAEFSVEQAGVILASQDLRVKVREVDAINKVRMPVWRDGEDGEKVICLLDRGYDAVTRTLTLSGWGDYDEGMDPEAGVAWIRRLLKYFEWADERSMAVQVALMLSVFCRNLFDGRAPLFLLNANLVGSGKSVLGQLALQPVHRAVSPSGWDFGRADENKKEMDGAAQALLPYIFYDDVPKGKVRSADLNRFVSAPGWRCRIMGGKEIYEGPLRTLVVMTGNQTELSEDLGRRALIADLFARLEAKDRVLPDDAIEMTESFFADENLMNRTLGAMWSLVRWWDQMGRPLVPTKKLAGFERWSSVVGSMVWASALGDPLLPFTAPDAGANEGREYRELVRRLLDESIKGVAPDEKGGLWVDVMLSQVVATARRHGFFLEQLGNLESVLETEGQRGGWKEKKVVRVTEMGQHEEDPSEEERIEQAMGWLDPKLRSWWGKKWRKEVANGRYFPASNGDLYQVGDRESRLATFRLLRVRSAKGQMSE